MLNHVLKKRCRLTKAGLLACAAASLLFDFDGAEAGYSITSLEACGNNFKVDLLNMETFALSACGEPNALDLGSLSPGDGIANPGTADVRPTSLFSCSFLVPPPPFHCPFLPRKSMHTAPGLILQASVCSHLLWFVCMCSLKRPTKLGQYRSPSSIRPALNTVCHCHCPGLTNLPLSRPRFRIHFAFFPMRACVPGDLSFCSGYA